MSVVVALSLSALLPTKAAVPSGPWKLTSDLTTCTMTRRFVAERSRYEIEVGTTISGSKLYLRILQPGQQLSRADLSGSPFVSGDGDDIGGGEGVATVSVDLGSPVPMQYSWLQPGRAADRITSFAVQPAMFDALAAGVRFAIEGISAPIMMEIPPAPDAFAALAECRQQRLDDWGLSAPTPDRAKLARLVPDRSNALDPADLSSAVRQTAANGRISLTVLVNADGSAARCFASNQSRKGAAKYDCLAAVTKMRWTPATDSAGKPVAYFYNFGVMMR